MNHVSTFSVMVVDSPLSPEFEDYIFAPLSGPLKNTPARG